MTKGVEGQERAAAGTHQEHSPDQQTGRRAVSRTSKTEDEPEAKISKAPRSHAGAIDLEQVDVFTPRP